MGRNQIFLQHARQLTRQGVGLAVGWVTLNIYAYVDGNPIARIDPHGLDWWYNQSTGHLEHVDNMSGQTTDYGYGYAGRGDGLNSPSAQGRQGIGPLPQGTYTIGPKQNNVTNSGHTLRNSMRLTPLPTNNMFGRAGFLIHGDNRLRNNTASQGCMIFDGDVRDAIGSSGDPVLRVYDPVPSIPSFFSW